MRGDHKGQDRSGAITEPFHDSRNINPHARVIRRSFFPRLQGRGRRRGRWPVLPLGARRAESIREKGNETRPSPPNPPHGAEVSGSSGLENWLILLLALLPGCEAVVLAPAGDIAAQQRDLLVMSVVLMLIIIIPVMQLLLFGYAINTTPRHLPTAVLLQEDTDLGRSILKEIGRASCRERV